jgi:putative ABC transport system substrate-binding protein
MKRREFISLVGGAAAWPLAAHAQQVGKVPTIGFLGSATVEMERDRTAALVQRLRELGWIENRTITIEYLWAEGRDDRAGEIAGEFVRRKVDVIVTAGTTNILAAKQATSAIPIVFCAAGETVANGLVASLARPGGNVTGLSVQAPDLVGKRLGILRDVIPSLRRLAIMGKAGNPTSALQFAEAEEAAGTLGLDIIRAEIRTVEDFGPAFEALKDRADAVFVTGDPLMVTNRIRVATLSLGARLPTAHNAREFVESGGLMSYGPNISDLYRRAGDYIDKILRGAKPADIPVEQPTKFELVINLATAKALGLKLTEAFLLRADEVIE